MEKEKNEKQKKNVNEDEEIRHIMSNPITKGTEDSIAMGIDTMYSPLPLWFDTKADKDK
jgi:hypothetical protein